LDDGYHHSGAGRVDLTLTPENPVEKPPHSTHNKIIFNLGLPVSSLTTDRRFFLLVVVGLVGNLLASMATYLMLVSRSAVETDLAVQPGSFASLAKTEGLILLISIVLLLSVKNRAERGLLQCLVTGVLLADAVHDVILLVTGSWYLSLLIPFVVAASLPAFYGMSLVSKSESSHQLREPKRSVG
jgi:hypothetical protein